MKKNIIIMTLPLLLLFVLVWADAVPTMKPKDSEVYTTASPDAPEAYTSSIRSKAPRKHVQIDEKGISQQLVSYATSFIGSPYVYAGMNPEGFDCSGFITYVYQNFDLDLPHSSVMQAEEGERVSKQEARAGDLVIFTGTNPQIREPGHVGIVISSPGDTIEFVHSSSNGGVKISKVEGTRYDIRFLQIRRVL
ncbi:C40 family peptidase [Pontibacter sp. MBLB2868]|uniref:C40 family peptidase n=1 Tax=Pontibacter sp. MBLB2868 TaxID=3451555 RepID=UPI003F752C66